MEKKIQIKTDDNHIIYGTLNSRNKSKKLIIFVHGLTGHQNEHIYYNGYKFFNSNDFDTFRFDLYSEEKKGRKLVDCSIKTHSKDLDKVIKNFEKDYSEKFLVGHSLGGPTILGANLESIISVVLWEPALKFKEFEPKNYTQNMDTDKCILHWRVDYFVSREMIDEW